MDRVRALGTPEFVQGSSNRIECFCKYPKEESWRRRHASTERETQSEKEKENANSRLGRLVATTKFSLVYRETARHSERDRQRDGQKVGGGGGHTALIRLDERRGGMHRFHLQPEEIRFVCGVTGGLQSLGSFSTADEVA